MTRDDFAKKLRLIVRDDALLRATIVGLQSKVLFSKALTFLHGTPVNGLSATWLCLYLLIV
jgi:hypothetical protein